MLCFVTILKLIFVVLLCFIIFILVLKYWADSFVTCKCKCKASLVGKIALITGGNTGIGLETARDLARRGAKVIIASRDLIKSAKAVEDIKRTTGNNDVEYKYLDLSKFSEVRKFAKDFNVEYERLDILVNNSGCAGLKRRITEDNIHVMMQVNYVSPFLLTNLLIQKLIQCQPSRIVNVSSCLHKVAMLDLNDVAGLNIKCHWHCYANSKLCQVLWTKALAKKLPKNVTANSVHPGLVNTKIYIRLYVILRQIWYFVMGFICKTPEEGAQSVIHLCVSPFLVDSGDYYVECRKSQPTKAAFNDELIKKVWNETADLVKKTEM